MANDRVKLRCKKCGEQMLLFKFNGGGEVGPFIPFGGKQNVDPRDHFDRVESATDWVERHIKECRGAFGNTLEGDSGFELAVESAT